MNSADERLMHAFLPPVDGNTTTQAISGSAAAVTLSSKTDYHFTSDVAYHMIFTKVGGGDATTSDRRFTAEFDYYFNTRDFTRVSIIKASGEADGTIWITEQE